MRNVKITWTEQPLLYFLCHHDILTIFVENLATSNLHMGTDMNSFHALVQVAYVLVTASCSNLWQLRLMSSFPDLK